MVTATDDPKVWRVGIDISHSPQSKSEIVCYLVLKDDKVRVYYSHHVLYSRAISAGPWSEGSATRQFINPLLAAMIESAMAGALWEIARGDEALQVLPFPTELNRLTPSIKELEL